MRLLVLANSKKFNGRCIAGIDLDSGKWIRPVSNTEHGEFTGIECSVTVGSSRRQVQSLDYFKRMEGRKSKTSIDKQFRGANSECPFASASEQTELQREI